MICICPCVQGVLACAMARSIGVPQSVAWTMSVTESWGIPCARRAGLELTVLPSQYSFQTLAYSDQAFLVARHTTPTKWTFSMHTNFAISLPLRESWLYGPHFGSFSLVCMFSAFTTRSILSACVPYEVFCSNAQHNNSDLCKLKADLIKSLNGRCKIKMI